jgi:hypothetical protein
MLELQWCVSVVLIGDLFRQAVSHSPVIFPLWTRRRQHSFAFLRGYFLLVSCYDSNMAAKEVTSVSLFVVIWYPVCT